MGKRHIGVIEPVTVACGPSLASEALSVAEAHAMAGVFAALGDPVRLRMLSIIAANEELCSCTLEGPLAKSQPTISHHTRILSDAGLIVGEKRGRWTWWRVVPERLEEAARLLAT